jgi:hypothetical protein
MTTRKLRQLLAVWQSRLRLQDVAITVEFVKDLKSEDQDCYGLCLSDRAQPAAHIQIRSDAVEGTEAPPHEWVLIHELLHVLMPDIQPAEYEEPAINKIAWALFKAYSPQEK